MKIGLMTVTQSLRAASPSVATPVRTSAPAPTPGLPYFRPRGVLFAGAAYWPSAACDLDLDLDAPALERRSMPS